MGQLIIQGITYNNPKQVDQATNIDSFGIVWTARFPGNPPGPAVQPGTFEDKAPVPAPVPIAFFNPGVSSVQPGTNIPGTSVVWRNPA